MGRGAWSPRWGAGGRPLPDPVGHVEDRVLPYATGSAPVYYASGYITRREFWRLGAIFGAIYLAVLLGLGLPYLVALTR